MRFEVIGYDKVSASRFNAVYSAPSEAQARSDFAYDNPNSDLLSIKCRDKVILPIRHKTTPHDNWRAELRQEYAMLGEELPL